MREQPWRIAIITGIAPIASAFAGALRDLGHEPRRGSPSGMAPLEDGAAADPQP